MTKPDAKTSTSESAPRYSSRGGDVEARDVQEARVVPGVPRGAEGEQHAGHDDEEGERHAVLAYEGEAAGARARPRARPRAGRPAAAPQTACVRGSPGRRTRGRASSSASSAGRARGLRRARRRSRTGYAIGSDTMKLESSSEGIVRLSAAATSERREVRPRPPGEQVDGDRGERHEGRLDRLDRAIAVLDARGGASPAP